MAMLSKLFNPFDGLTAAANRGNIVAMIQQALRKNGFRLLVADPSTCAAAASSTTSPAALVALGRNPPKNCSTRPRHDAVKLIAGLITNSTSSCSPGSPRQKPPAFVRYVRRGVSVGPAALAQRGTEGRAPAGLTGVSVQRTMRLPTLTGQDHRRASAIALQNSNDQFGCSPSALNASTPYRLHQG
jgi:hypothetical protein